MKSFIKRNLPKALAAALYSAGVASLAVASLAVAPALSAPANPPPSTYAYGPAGQPIAPLYGGLLGSYEVSLTSGTIAAGIAADLPIWSFQYTGPGLAVIKKVRVSIADTGTAFAAGNMSAQLFAARAFTAADTGGTAATLTTNNGKLRTSFPTTGVGNIQIANTGTMSAGTRTLDAQPMAAATLGVPAVAGQSLTSGTEIFYPQNAGDYPYVAATNEGLVLQVHNAPATGTWTVSVIVEWDEYSAY